jgi:RNA polymerase sigma factor (sigma-70 family)
MVTKYKETGEVLYFEQAYALTKKQIVQTARKYSAAFGIPYEDFLSEGNIRFIGVIDSYNAETGEFVHVLSRALRNAFITMNRSADNKAEYTNRYIAGDEKEIDVFEDVIISGITRDASAEAESLVFSKERSEMLTSLLVDVDEVMIATIRAFLAEKSLVKAGAKLGVSHTTVKRRLESLARKYDANKYGQVSDYLEGVETIV